MKVNYTSAATPFDRGKNKKIFQENCSLQALPLGFRRPNKKVLYQKRPSNRAPLLEVVDINHFATFQAHQMTPALMTNS